MEQPMGERKTGESLRDVGDDPDPRFTFANERTFLAWNRTALAMIAAGLAVGQLLKFGIEGIRIVIALPLLLLGALTAVSSYRRWDANERAMRLEEPIPYSSLPRVLAFGVGTVALASAVAVVVDLAAK